MNEIDQTIGDRQADSTPDKRVRHFRQVLLWPVNLLPIEAGTEPADHGARLAAKPDHPWREVVDEFTGDPANFQERHYNEFVTFLPPVQRFLYGQGLGKSVRGGYGESPIRVMRRSDISALRVTLMPDDRPITFSIAHIDLYFYYDIDVAMLALEIHADDLPLTVAQETMFKLGRAYPGYWEDDGRAGHCPWRVELLAPDGRVLSVSDFENKRKFLNYACEHRAPAIAAHWEYLLNPLVLHHSDQKGALRYRQLEYYRMPLMAYLAMENPGELTRADQARLALASGAGDSDKLPLAESHLSAFEREHGYDLYQESRESQDWSGTRHFVTRHSFVVIGAAGNRFFMHAERGYLSRFRHQHFLLFMIAHFHRASLLMFSDQLSRAVTRLDIGNAETIRTFRVESREALETFLRFTHRYWFHDLTDQVQASALFQMCRKHLRLDHLYDETRQELQDMGQFLEAEAMRRQNTSMIRLTVVTILGMIGTVSTGFLGMNLMSWGELEPEVRVAIFFAVFAPMAALTFYTVNKSARLSEFLDALSDESQSVRDKLRALGRVWWTSKGRK